MVGLVRSAQIGGALLRPEEQANHRPPSARLVSPPLIITVTRPWLRESCKLSTGASRITRASIREQIRRHDFRFWGGALAIKDVGSQS
jgi:hypothetical protein